MTNIHIALVSYQKKPLLSNDDKYLYHALRQLEIQVDTVSWHDKNINWGNYNAVIIRSTWDYYQHIDKYRQWLETLKSANTNLINSADIILKNLDKHYLLELLNLGVRVIPTIYFSKGEILSSDKIFEVHSCKSIVVKPSIGASAWGVRKFTQLEFNKNLSSIQNNLNQGSLLIQPYLHEISTKGEWSLMFINGHYSHAVIKQPDPNDFRVQGQYGGQYIDAKPNKKTIDYASYILSNILTIKPFYARVDGVIVNNKFTLIELELNEPCLYFKSDTSSASRFAQQILKKLTTKNTT